MPPAMTAAAHGRCRRSLPVACPPHQLTRIFHGPRSHFTALAGKRIGVLGHGGSLFSRANGAANTAAASVDLCFRRTLLPSSTRIAGWESRLLAHYAR